MAKAKQFSGTRKSAPKSAKKPARKLTTAAKKPARRPKKAPQPALTSDERRKLLKMRDDSDDVGERAAALWKTRKDVRVSGLTPSKLLSLVAKAKKAQQREQLVRAQMEAKLRPLQDARLVAEDVAYRAMLDLHAQVKVLGRNDPSVLEAFAFLAEHVGRTRDPAPDPAPSPDEKR
jgi:hypothetical protein